MPTGQQSFITDPQNNVAVVAQKGQVYTNECFPFVMASYHMSITAASGGTNLPSVPCGKIELQNLSGNHVMWLGGVDQHAPFSGRGNEIFPMSVIGHVEKTLYCNNANQFSMCASVSGELISFIAYGNGQNITIDPTTQGTAPNTTIPIITGWS